MNVTRLLQITLTIILLTTNTYSANRDSLRFTNGIVTGASRLGEYLTLLQGKKIALVANNSSRIGEVHLADTLLSLHIAIEKVFSPEHGFRGTADAGEEIGNYKDPKTGLSVLSLYGNSKKPKAADLKGVDIVVFDIQDVGARFYTYISTMHYVMEACAENNIPFMVLDRPNPNGFYVDGPIREKKFKSFVGMHPVPIVHGLTIGEYAQMINGEGWLAKGKRCDLKIISCANYKHSDMYALPVKPSPNLPNMISVYLYPSLCLFEGTLVSVGRGTDKPFQQFGFPGFKMGNEIFQPQSIPGAKNPPYKDTLCNAIILSDSVLSEVNRGQLNLSWLLIAYKNRPVTRKFFNHYFDTLAGTDKLRKQVIENCTEKEIRASWSAGLENFKIVRKKYLLYADF
jgi:uncharacterized protein YbbC (DUF1343 family)